MRSAPLRAGVVWMLVGLGARSIAQLVYFVLIARALGSAGYGAFVAVAALVAVAAPFATWGSGNLLVQHVARDRSCFATWWGAALATTLLAGFALVALATLVGHVALPGVPAALVVLVALADLLCARFADLAGQAYQAFDRLDRTALAQTLPGVARLLAAAALPVFDASPTALTWAVLYFTSTAAVAALALLAVRRDLGWGALDPRPVWREASAGAAYAVNLAAHSVHNDLDKTLLARFASSDAAGVYAAAYRLVDAALTPVRALLAAAYARFFRAGQAGLTGSAAFARRLALPAAAYGLLAGASLFVLAPALPLLFGPPFAETAEVLRWLAPLALLRALQGPAADALTGAGRQTLRTVTHAAVAAVNVALNVWWLPAHGWRGAAWASLACDALLAGALWCAVAVGTSKGRRAVRA